MKKTNATFLAFLVFTQTAGAIKGPSVAFQVSMGTIILAYVLLSSYKRED